MRDADCVAFLQWALPRLRLRWPGFRKVRRQVGRRIDRRLRALGLADVLAYRAHLERDALEWNVLDSFCRIPISRFHRDRAVFARALAGLRDGARCWSAGCASGEEPYTLAIAARMAGHRLDIVATDSDAHLLGRAAAARYRHSSLKEMPPAWIDGAFMRSGSDFVLRAEYREGVRLLEQDLREEMPAGPFDVVFCRYVAFTYFDAALQAEILARLVDRLAPGGLLVIGSHERLPENGLIREGPSLYRTVPRDPR